MLVLACWERIDEGEGEGDGDDDGNIVGGGPLTGSDEGIEMPMGDALVRSVNVDASSSKEIIAGVRLSTEAELDAGLEVTSGAEEDEDESKEGGKEVVEIFNVNMEFGGVSPLADRVV